MITEGAQVQFHAPEVMRELMSDPSQWRSGIRIPASTPFAAELVLSNANGLVTYKFLARTVPPPPGAFGALAGYIGAALVEISFAMLSDEDGHARATFHFSTSFGRSAGNNMYAARVLHSWCTHGQLTFRSDELYPEGIGGKAENRPDHELCEELEWRERLYSDMVLLESNLGIELPVPTR